MAISMNRTAGHGVPQFYAYFVERLLVATCAALIALASASSPALLAAESKQTVFASPEEACTALIVALKADDTKALLGIFGTQAKSLVESGDAVADRESFDHFVERYDQKHVLVPVNDTKQVLQVGDDTWPMPIPLVKTDAGWRFDTAAGQDEIIARRIGRNELDAIQACLAYTDAQREYYQRNPEGGKLLHYAQKFASTKGKRDGLYWDAADDEAQSPLGPLFITSHAEGYKLGTGKPQPYHGYYFRILTAQGPDAPGGAYNYVVKGKMMGGFALVAYPAGYGSSGVMTFIVNHAGQVYQKDLGPKTTAIAQAMKTFNPDSTWSRVDAADEAPEVSANPLVTAE